VLNKGKNIIISTLLGIKITKLQNDMTMFVSEYRRLHRWLGGRHCANEISELPNTFFYVGKKNLPFATFAQQP